MWNSSELDKARALFVEDPGIIRQKRPEEVLGRFRKLRPGEATLSVITYGIP